jgi:GTP cyclohydrolase II
MFTYLDPHVREKLVASGKLQGLDRDGRRSIAGNPPVISVLGPIPLPLQRAGREFSANWYAAVRHTELARVQQLADSLIEQDARQSFALLASSMAVNSVLVFGDRAAWTHPLVRVHSSCLTGDVFGSQRCECGPQFVTAMERIDNDREGGIIVYMSGHEGRGIGLWAKAATYLLQDAGENTYEANRSLGLPDDSRDFSDAAVLLKYFLDGRPFRFLTNNPKKVADLAAQGLEGITQVKHVSGVTEANRRYLAAKRDWGHLLEPTDLDKA